METVLSREAAYKASAVPKGPTIYEKKPLNGASVDPHKVLEGLNRLGHKSQKIFTPNMAKSRARDLSFFMQTDMIYNVLRDNENMNLDTSLVS